MKIVLFCRNFSTDFEYMQNAYARQFCREGHDVTILTTTRQIHKKYNALLNNEDQHSERPVGMFEEGGYKVLRLKGKSYGSNDGFERLPGFAAALKALSPDLLFFQSVENYPLALQAALLKLRYGYSYYLLVNEHFIYARGCEEKGKSWLKEAVKKQLERWSKRGALFLANRIITMNEYSADYTRKLYWGSSGKMIDVTLGVDLHSILFRPESRKKIRQQYHLKSKDTLIIHTGKMAPYKKTHILLKAIARLQRRDVKLMLVGKCESLYRTELDRIISQHHLQEQVLFVSWVAPEQLHHYFSAADIAVWVDHATISTIEASAVGIPVIVPDFYGYEHRTKNNNGLRIQPGDLNDLTVKLRRLVENTAERREMGQRGRELVEKELNWTSIVDKILN